MNILQLWNELSSHEGAYIPWRKERLTPLRMAVDFATLKDWIRSLEEPLETDRYYRRVVATAKDAFEFHHAFASPPDPAVYVIPFNGWRLIVGRRVIIKAARWVESRSQKHALEVMGQFIYRQKASRLYLLDFIPQPSYCRSLKFDSGRDMAWRIMASEQNMRSFTVGDPEWELDFFLSRLLGLLDENHEIPMDGQARRLPFQSRSRHSPYQDVPAPCDFDGLNPLKWIYSPTTGKHIIYNAISGATAIIRF